ncbi:MAG TPA: lanthionine synthetase C family protein [Thermoanaerobaculia bacterium]
MSPPETLKLTETREPLLYGDLAAAACEAVEAILADLSARSMAEATSEELTALSPLANGAAGIALFFAYAHLAFPERGLDDLCLQTFQEALATTAAEREGPSLFSGFLGVGWVLRHLEGRIFDADEDPGAEVESALLQGLARYPDIWSAELISGLAGFGLYFLERLPGEGARRGTERVIELLAAQATEEGGTVSWFNPLQSMPASHRESYPNGYFNLGVSHGIPGAIGFLAAAHRRGVATGESRRLAEGAVRWLLDHRLPASSGSTFPGYAGPGIEPVPTRLAWCYGDPGVAMVLWLAGRAFAREDWEREALAVARRAAKRGETDVSVVDAGLCHGTAGLAHTFHRLFRATGDEALREAALFWIQRTLDQRRPGHGVGGFSLAETGASGPGRWSEEAGFLTGAAGIALALLAALTPVEPEWDRVMLLSFPNGGEESRAHHDSAQ